MLLSRDAQLPSAWKTVAFATPDYAVNVSDSGGAVEVAVRLAKAAELTVRVPVRAAAVTVRLLSRSTSPQRESIRFRLALRTYALMEVHRTCGA